MLSKALEAEVGWMACALIKARDSAVIYRALADLVRGWPEAKLCALAAKLSPAPGQARDHGAAMAAIHTFSEGMPREVAARMRATAEELAQISDVFRAQ